MKEGGLLIVLVTIINTSNNSLPKATYLIDLSLGGM